MESVYVVRLKDGTDLLLLAEIGLDKSYNVTFDKDGRQATYLRARFAAESESPPAAATSVEKDPETAGRVAASGPGAWTAAGPGRKRRTRHGRGAGLKLIAGYLVWPRS
jgi:hypothetical protein